MDEPPKNATCPSCKEKIHAEAEVCPHCRKRLKTSFITKAVLGFILFFCFVAIIKNSVPTAPIQAAKIEQPRCPNMPDRAAQMDTLRQLEGTLILHTSLKNNKHWYLTVDPGVWNGMMKKDAKMMDTMLFCLSLIEGKDCCREVTVQDRAGVVLESYAGPK